MTTAVKKLGLVLTGGGARAAYQAGVLRAIAELGGYPESPFRILTGISAGAINAASIASHTDDFDAGTKRLWHFWEHLKFEDVIDTRATSFFSIGSLLLKELALGGMLGTAKSNHLLDSSPLRPFLKGKMNFDRIVQHLASGELHAVAVSVTDYYSGDTITFFDAGASISHWTQGFHLAVPSHITLEHVLASSAIPLFFAPIRVGDKLYGDGGIRFATPLSPAIHLGADAILAIGVRHRRSPEESLASHGEAHLDRISFAEITGILLNAIFLDSLDTDVKRMNRINELLKLVPQPKRALETEALREIPLLALKPSKDLGTLATERLDFFPKILRHMLRGLGASGEKSRDLLSYLAFEGAYTGRLLKLGYEDAMSQKEELLSFLASALQPSSFRHRERRVHSNGSSEKGLRA